MSIASEITRIAGLRDTIRSKLIDFGIITDASANLSACATAIDGISKVTPSTPATTISITTAPTLNTSTGVVTLSASKSASVKPTVSKGYTDGTATAGTITATVSSTLQLSPVLAAKTYTPKATAQTIAAGRWLTGAQTISGDANLVAANIKDGVSIFGVAGSANGALKYSAGSAYPTNDKQTFIANLSTSATKSLYYLTIASGGMAPIGFLAYGTGDFAAHCTMSDGTAEDSSGNVYLKYLIFDNYGYLYGIYVPYTAGETSIVVPVPASTVTFKYWIVSGG